MATSVLSSLPDEWTIADVRLVWYLDPDAGTVEVYTAPDQCTVVAADGILDGGDVLPGFRLSLAEFFDRSEGPGPE